MSGRKRNKHDRKEASERRRETNEIGGRRTREGNGEYDIKS